MHWISISILVHECVFDLMPSVQLKFHFLKLGSYLPDVFVRSVRSAVLKCSPYWGVLVLARSQQAYS